ncbi:MAG TPA: SDR family oxidoreductase [Anaerolineales bacterium]|nr:SDR family oxidoreductase [Anaerolineales bacterium]
MRVLVTGASGLLGANLALEAAKDHTVYGLVNTLDLHTEAFQVLKGDLAEPGEIERLLDITQPEWVIHCAALANVDACETDQARAVQLNTEVPRKLAINVARGGARLLHVSTDAVFDGIRGNYVESDPPNPLSVYARTKLDGERAVAEANPDAMIARVNLFGWSPSGRRSLAEWFFNNLSTGKPVMGFTDVYFCPLLANDLGKIFLDMLQNQLRGLYHVVARDCQSKYEFGVQLARLFNLDAGLIQPASVMASGLAAARSPNLTLNTAKLTRALGYPPPDIQQGLQSFYQLHQQNYPHRLREML